MVKNQPAYARIRDAIAHQITSGQVPENAKLPTERDMCQMYDVSRITIRHALTLLEQDGLIRKRQGQGIFVCPKRFEQSLNTFYTFSDELRRQNIMPSWKLLSMELYPIPADIARLLNLSEHTMCYDLRRVSFADNRPYAYEELCIPEPLLAGATAEQIERDGVYKTIRKVSGLACDRCDETYESILAAPEIAAILSRKTPLAVIKLTRRSFVDDCAMEHSVRYILGDKYRFRLSFR